ncbi:MAG: hypothetical protein NTZ49_05830 [Candidatus Parcubacteria bacterium]|nr:hypothetical protein [Candidatus Parcubacteria bacterium]
MEDLFIMPDSGDILYQRATITLKKPGSRPSMLITVSNEYGVIENKQLNGTHTKLIFQDNFEEQYAPDLNNPGVFLTTVTFEGITEDGKVKFFRHDKTGKKLPLECFEPKDQFFKTHFLPSNDRFTPA